MSVIKFKLTEDHIKLAKHLVFDANNENGYDVPVINTKRLFGNSDIFEDVYLIIYGKAEEKDFDEYFPWNEQRKIWDDEQFKYMKKLLSEMPIALNIILNAQSFETGEYKTKSYVTDWKKFN